MPKIAVSIILFLVAVAPIWAVAKYEDDGCPSNGDGTSITCGANGPWNSITNAIAGEACGDTVNVRGSHSSHGTCPGTNGLHNYNVNTISGKACGAGTQLVWQPYNYSGPGTGEIVYMDGATDPGTWTQCSTCTSGTCNGVPGTCSETWFITGSGNFNNAEGSQKSDKSPTYRVTASGGTGCIGSGNPFSCCTGAGTGTCPDLTNSHGGYNGKTCATTTWMRCNNANDCPSGEACSGTSTEIDSYSAQTAGTALLVRWVTSPNSMSPKPMVFNDDTGTGFLIQNSAYVTVQGFNFRCHAREAVSLDPSGGATNNSTVRDNRIYYADHRFQSGPDYGIAMRAGNNNVIDGNNIAYTTSEGIHTRPLATGPTILTISNNWIHDIGDQTVLGPDSVGSPAGIIMARDGIATDGNWTGTIISGNLFQRTAVIASVGGKGIILEDQCSNTIIRDNVFNSLAGAAIKLDGQIGAISGHQIFNNLFLNNGTFGGERDIRFVTAPTIAASSNSIYNNTFVGNPIGAIDGDSGACQGTCASNLIRNNILYSSGSVNQMFWSNTDATNIFDFNLVVTAASPAITWLNVTRTCAQLSLAGAGNINNCPSPVFVSTGANDYHIQTTSPAKDVGTATGMPAGRTIDIVNTIVGSRGLPSYSDGNAIQNAVWDIGLDEFIVVAGGQKRRGLLRVGPRWPICEDRTEEWPTCQ